MKTLILLLSILVISISAGYSQSNVTTAKWLKDEYKNVQDIPHLDYLYDVDQKLFYLITNDSANLYINLKAADQSTQKKILMFGLTVWIDKDAKNKKNTGLRFPVPNEGDPENNNRPMVQGLDFNEIKQEIVDNANEIELIGFSGKNSSEIISTLANNAIHAAMFMDTNGDLLYQLCIPLKQLEIDYNPENLLSVNLESGEAKMKGQPGKMKGERPGGGMAGGGMPGGRMPSGNRNPEMMQNRMNDFNQMSTPIKIKLKKVRLSAK